MQESHGNKLMVNEVKTTSSKALALVSEMLKVSICVYECPRKGKPWAMG